MKIIYKKRTVRGLVKEQVKSIVECEIICDTIEKNKIKITEK